MEKIFFTSPNLNEIKWLKHGFFSRNGGVSKGIYKTLNCSFNSKDSKQNILQNRDIVLNHLNIANSSLFIPNQVHGNRAEIVSNKNQTKNITADALITKTNQITIGILTADCAPLLIVDKKIKIISNIHCGWKGTLNGVIENSINKMMELGSSKRNLIAAIGPCISPKSYEVKKDFVDNFKKIEKNIKDYFILGDEQSIFFNLPLYIERKLIKNGVGDIFAINIDTYSNEKFFFSYRKSTHNNDLDYGRQLTILSIIN